MDIKTLQDAASVLAAYPPWVKILVAVTITMMAASALELLLSPKRVPVETVTVDKWLLASNETYIKALVPEDMFEDWQKKRVADYKPIPQEMLEEVETKKHTVDDLIHQVQELAAQQLGYGNNPLSPSADIGELKLKQQRAERELAEAQQRVNDYVSRYITPKVYGVNSERNAAKERVEQFLREKLATGKLVARGIPNEAPPHENEQIIIRPSQWQYLQLSISTGNVTDDKGTVFKGVEIGKPKE